MEIILAILVLVVGILLYITWNLNNKVLKQEDIIESQVEYLRKVSYIIAESKLYVDNLDEKGIFRADDEIGTFFNFMKEIQDALNGFRLEGDYGKK
jgi:hypothetical protein